MKRREAEVWKAISAEVVKRASALEAVTPAARHWVYCESEEAM